jgi:hypothetical protein
MISRMLPSAEAELEEAVIWYRRRSADLGERFRRAVDRAIVKMLDHPLRWPRISGEYRKCRVTGFPYALIYRNDPQELVVVAVMYLGRKPGYWRDRE